MTIQDQIFAWVCSMFGKDVATNASERVFRHVEEAIELAQALNIDKDSICRLVEYVYARPSGAIAQEFAGSAITLYAAAQANGYDLDEEIEKELERIHEPKVISRCQRRQNEKRFEIPYKKIE